MFITLKSKESNWLFCKISSINRCKPVISEILRTKKHVWKNLTKWIGLCFLIWTISFTGFSQQLCKEIKCHLTKRFGIPGKPVLFEFSWWDCWRLFNSHQGGHHRDSGAVEAKCVSLAGFGFFFFCPWANFENASSLVKRHLCLSYKALKSIPSAVSYYYLSRSLYAPTLSIHPFSHKALFFTWC